MWSGCSTKYVGCVPARACRAGTGACVASENLTATALNARIASAVWAILFPGWSRMRMVSPVTGSQREHEQHAAPRRVARQIRQSRPPHTHVERQVRGHVAGDEQAHVAADPGIDRDVLF